MRDFAELLRTPGLARVMASQLAARLPAGMFSLGMLMHVERVQCNYTSACTLPADVELPCTRSTSFSMPSETIPARSQPVRPTAMTQDSPRVVSSQAK